MPCGEIQATAEELPNPAVAAALGIGDVASRGSTVPNAVGQAAAQAAALRLLAALLRVGGAAMPAALRATADVAALHTATAAEAAVEVRILTCRYPCHCPISPPTAYARLLISHSRLRIAPSLCSAAHRIGYVNMYRRFGGVRT